MIFKHCEWEQIKLILDITQVVMVRNWTLIPRDSDFPKCIHLIEIWDPKYSHDFTGLLNVGKNTFEVCFRFFLPPPLLLLFWMLSDSWPGIDENVEMGLREKKERFSSFKRFTQESIFPLHCKKFTLQ